ncbi:glycosyltransferase family 4 protein [Haloarcula marina]|uniref:glycosyltransferase family 4 protein n=1 Tax=Haloarcula marina TaxID=2961574 RepID=UPI0020B6C7F6|nr:glycosyltransferase family 4 protein [Halomicroarcula marina]
MSNQISLTNYSPDVGFNSELDEKFLYRVILNLLLIPKIIGKLWSKDAVITDKFGPVLWISTIVGRVLHVPIYVRLRGNPVYEETEHIKYAKQKNKYIMWLLHGVNYYLLTITLPLTEAYILPSEWTKEQLPENNYYIVPTPIRQTTSVSYSRKSSMNEKNIVCVTNFDFKKKVEPLLYFLEENIDFIEKQNLNVQILGDGYLLEETKSKFADNDNIEFLGFRNDVVDYYKTAGIFLHLSKLDAYPTVVLEAFFHQVPVITNAQCGMKEQVEHRKSGLLVNLNNPEIKAAITEIQTNGALREQIIENAFYQVTTENTIRNVCDEFNTVLSDI